MVGGGEKLSQNQDVGTVTSPENKSRSGHNQDEGRRRMNIRPDKKTGCEAFKQFLWNPKTKEILGRTVLSWIKITIFYTIYYTFLSVFFCVYLFLFFMTLDIYYPKWQNTKGLMGGNPGVGFRPRPPLMESQLIWFRAGDEKGNWENWVRRYESEFLQEYYDYADNEEYTDRNGYQMNKVDCTLKRPGVGQVCMIKREGLFEGDCTPENNYGFRKGKPCIAIKLNKIYNWRPEVYTEDKTVYHKPPKDFPAELNATYHDNLKKAKEEDLQENKEKALLENEKVWIECHGQNAADKDNIGPIIYYPYMGFNANFYPYLNQDRYLSPIVFMQLRNPARGVLIAVECKAWAKNIEHNSMDRRGMVHFEVMID